MGQTVHLLLENEPSRRRLQESRERDKRLDSQRQIATNHDTNSKKGKQGSTTTIKKQETANAVVPDTENTTHTDEADTARDHFADTIGNRERAPAHLNNEEWNIVLGIRGRRLQTKVDTDAARNMVMPLKAYTVLQRQSPEPSNIQLTAYGGTKLDDCGRTIQEITCNGVTRLTEFIIVNENVYQHYWDYRQLENSQYYNRRQQ
jgi:hypothetical protein